MARRFVGIAMAGAAFGALAGCDALTEVTRTTYLNRAPDASCVVEAVKQFGEADADVVALPGNIPEDIGYGVRMGTSWPLSVRLEIRAEDDGPRLLQSYKNIGPKHSRAEADGVLAAMASVESIVLQACGVSSSRASEEHVRL